MATQSGGDVKLFFGVDGLDLQFQVLQFRGVEAISRLFDFTLELACDATQLAAGTGSVDKLFQQVVGRLALLQIQRDSGEARNVQGMIASFEQRPGGQRHAQFSARLVPWAWRLLHRHDCRIFQQLSARAIVCDGLLGPAHVPFQFSCKGNVDPKVREYCVQYRESDWNFVNRLLEQEGYFYFFEHTAQTHVMHVANHAHAHPAVAGDSSLLFHTPGGPAPAAEHVYAFDYREQVVPGAASLQDYNPWTPSLNLQASMSAPNPGSSRGLEHFDYPGNHATPEQGKAMARVRLEELQVQRKGAEGSSDCVRLIPGHYFELDGETAQHPGQASLLGRKYLVTEVVHSGETHGDPDSGASGDRCRYSNSFRCIPASVPFRPPRITRRPVVPGAQTAVVVGPEGEEIHTDKHGRVKVQFFWDRYGSADAQSSCWARVSQLWAGQRWGSMFIPRVGNEVIVEFLEGDPDRPVITGRVYHATNPPPLDLPAQATRSTIRSASSPGGGGANELRFEDKKGAEELYLHAQRDLTEVVRSDRSAGIGGNQAVTVGQHDTVTVQQGDRKLTVEAGKSTLTADKAVKIQSKAEEVRVMGQEVHVRGSGGKAGISLVGAPQVRASGSKEVRLQVGPAVGPTTVSTTLDSKGINLTAQCGAKVDIDGDQAVKVNSANMVWLTVGSARVIITPGGITVDAGGQSVRISGSDIELN